MWDGKAHVGTSVWISKRLHFSAAQVAWLIKRGRVSRRRTRTYADILSGRLGRTKSTSLGEISKCRIDLNEITYAIGMKVGLLVNIKYPKAEIRRMVLDLPEGHES